MVRRGDYVTAKKLGYFRRATDGDATCQGVLISTKWDDGMYVHTVASESGTYPCVEINAMDDKNLFGPTREFVRNMRRLLSMLDSNVGKGGKNDNHKSVGELLGIHEG